MKSNLVGKYLDFSAQDTSVEFQPVEFQDNVTQQFWSVKEPEGQNWSQLLRESQEKYRRRLKLSQYYQDRQRTRKRSRKET